MVLVDVVVGVVVVVIFQFYIIDYMNLIRIRKKFLKNINKIRLFKMVAVAKNQNVLNYIVNVFQREKNVMKAVNV